MRKWIGSIILAAAVACGGCRGPDTANTPADGKSSEQGTDQQAESAEQTPEGTITAAPEHLEDAQALMVALQEAYPGVEFAIELTDDEACIQVVSMPAEPATSGLEGMDASWLASDAAFLAGRVLAMDRGRKGCKVRWVGPPEEVREGEQLPGDAPPVPEG